jgi:hypothetical protein
MILRPAMSSSGVWLVSALLFGGMLMFDTVQSGHEYAVAVTGPPDAWMVPTSLNSDVDVSRAFVSSFAREAFDLAPGCEEKHKDAARSIAPTMREGFASMFWSKPACGHDVKFQLTSVDPVDLGATNGAWFEVHGEFTHGKLAPMPVTVCVLVGGTPEGGMQVEGYSELTDPLEKLMVASCEDADECQDDCEHR